MLPCVQEARPSLEFETRTKDEVFENELARVRAEFVSITHITFLPPCALYRAQLNGHVCSPQKQESRKEEARNEIITPRLAKDIAPSQEE